MICGQVIGQKWHACPHLGIHFLAITQPFLGQSNWFFCGLLSISRYLLYIGKDKFNLWDLFSYFDYLGHFPSLDGKMGTGPPRGLGPQYPTNNLGHWARLFTISKPEPLTPLRLSALYITPGDVILCN